jgi:hypothetical protein
LRRAIPTLRDRPPEGAQWLHEIKIDGYDVRLGDAMNGFLEQGKAETWSQVEE